VGQRSCQTLLQLLCCNDDASEAGSWLGMTHQRLCCQQLQGQLMLLPLLL
jgi:hypothetical protein